MRRSASPSCRAGLFAAVFVTGCNLLTGASDLSFDQGGGPGTGPADAQPDTAVVVLPEAGTVDGPIDPDGGGPVPPACAPGAIFCDDFDSKDGLRKWGSIKIGGGTSNIDTLASVSPPSSLLMTWPATPVGSTVGVELQTEALAVTGNVRLTFSVRLEQTGGKDGEFLAVAQIAFGSASTLRFTVNKGGNTQLEEVVSSGSGGPPTTTIAPLTRALNQSSTFQTVEITLSLAKAPAAAAVKIGGLDAGSKMLSSAAGNLAVVLGDRDVVSNDRAWRIRYDNVVVIAQ